MSQLCCQVRKRKEGATEISASVRAKLEGEGILRRKKSEVAEEEEEEVEEEGQNRLENTWEKKKTDDPVEAAARLSGGLLPRKSIRISFDTFQAKVRPGLVNTSSEEEEEMMKTMKSDANTMTRIMLGRMKKGGGWQTKSWRKSHSV